MADGTGNGHNRLVIDFDELRHDDAAESEQIVFLADGSAMTLEGLKRAYLEAKEALALKRVIDYHIESGGMVALVPTKERKHNNG